MPDLDQGTYPILVMVGTGIAETTAVVSFKVTQQSESVASGLAPLISADNLERAFLFDNLSKSWLFFDPRPVFAPANTLTVLEQNKIYWLKIKRDQSTTLNGQLSNLTCIGEGTPREDCWNQVVW